MYSRQRQGLQVPYTTPYRSVYAIVIGLENYRRRSLTGVDFALADAHAFADTLREIHDDLAPDDVRVEVIANADASLTALQDAFGYAAFALGPDDLFVLYYAGHGYHTAAGNRLTAYDTNPQNLTKTTLDLSKDALEPLADGKCRRALLFVDACAEHVQEFAHARDVVGDLNPDELRAFLHSGWYLATFLACSPGEKSYSLPSLGHGVWTHHLLQALRGETSEPLVEGDWLTDAGLRDWLRLVVPRYLTRKTTIQGKQTPQAIVSSSNTFAIRYLKPPQQPQHNTLSPIGLQVTDAYLESTQSGEIRRLPGFQRGFHTTPADLNESAYRWVCRLLADTVADDVQEVYSTSKQVLNVRRRDTESEANPEGGSVDTPVFRYTVEPSQNPDDPAEYVLVRRLKLREHWATLRDVIGDAFDHLIVEFRAPNLDFDELVDRLEDIQSATTGSTLEDDERSERVYFGLPAGPTLVFDLGASRLDITIAGARSSNLLERYHSIGLGLPSGGHPMLQSMTSIPPDAQDPEPARLPAKASPKAKRKRARRR
ncbi:MAG: caspase family protein [Gammaproteobacteria bacterium]|nr:caspase family protein [Gammaproteobacteria bacterium]